VGLQFYTLHILYMYVTHTYYINTWIHMHIHTIKYTYNVHKYIHECASVFMYVYVCLFLSVFVHTSNTSNLDSSLGFTKHLLSSFDPQNNSWGSSIDYHLLFPGTYSWGRDSRDLQVSKGSLLMSKFMSWSHRLTSWA
jgi:hypothetical protein